MSLKINGSSTIQFQIYILGRKTAKLIDKDAALFRKKLFCANIQRKYRKGGDIVLFITIITQSL